MKISHQQARQRFEAALDNAHYYRRKPELDRDLAEHLAGCRECRAYTEQAAAIDARLAQHLPQSCEVANLSSPKIDAAIRKVQSRARRKRMIRFMTTTTRRVAILAGSLALIGGFIFLLNRLLFNLPVPLGNPTSTSTAPVENDNNVKNEENDTIDITITFAASPAEKSVYQPLMEAFHQEHPNITVQFVEQDSTVHMDARAQASLADVSFLSGRSGVIAGAGYFLELTPLMETDPNFQPEDFWPNAMTACQDREGRSYGIPLSLNFLGILYDPQALDADGLAHPKSGWTWERFRQTVNTMAVGDNLSRQYPFVDQPVSGESSFINLLAPIIDSYLVNNNGTIDPASLAQSLQWYIDLVQQKRIFPVTEFEKSQAYKDLFQDGYPAMYIGATNSWVDDGPALNRYNMVSYPVDSNAPGIPTSPMLAQCGIISAGANHPQEAWLWLNYLSHQWIHGDERLAYINQAAPARPSIANNNPYWEAIPANAQEAYRFGLEHGWYGSAYPDQLWAVTQALIESTDRGTPFANALLSKLTTLPAESGPSKPSEPIVVATPRPQNNETTTVRFFTYQVFENETKFKSLVEEFTRLHPEIMIELSNIMNPADFPSQGDERFDFQVENYDCFEYELPDLSINDPSILYDLNTCLDKDPMLQSDIFP